MLDPILETLNKYRHDSNDGDLWTDSNSGAQYLFTGEEWVPTTARTEEDLVAETEEMGYLKVHELYHDAPILAQFMPTQFILYNNDGNTLVSISLEDGEVTFSEHYTPSEAAAAFWKSIGQYRAGETDGELIPYETSTDRHNRAMELLK